MSSSDKQILERTLARGLLTKEQALEIARLRHKRKGEEGDAPPVEQLAVEKGYLSKNDAEQLRQDQEGFEANKEVGGYKLIKKIGAGAMGVVWKAKQLSLDRLVAIKLLSPHLARKPDYVKRFLREARAVARLNHPNVISGIDVGEEAGVRYFVMEYASGHSVGKILERGPMDETRVARVAVQIARALQHAHEAGLVHRDVKPDNILITKNGTAKLCDLGLAKDRPEEGRSLGTPNYISPEQAEAREVDIRSDLYSFGATLHHMLVGTPPFTGTAKVVMVKHLSEPVISLRETDPDISATLDGIVLKLMEKHPADRFQVPNDLVAALEEYEEEKRRKAAGPAAPTPASQRAPTRRRPTTRRRRR